MKDHVADLYSALVNGGYNVDDLGGSIDGFREAMSDSVMRKEFYDWVGRRGNFRLPDYDIYESALASTYDGLKSEVSPEEAKENTDSINSFLENRHVIMQPQAQDTFQLESEQQKRDREAVAQRMEDQAEAARKRLQEDGTIDRMKEAKKDARRDKLRAFGSMLGSTPQVTSFGVSTSVFDSTDEQLSDVGQALDAGTEYRQNKLLQEKLDVALDMARAGENIDGLRGVENFGLGLWDSATRLSTWDFGASDIVNNLTLQQIVEKWENDPSSLTATEKKVLDGIGMATAVQELYSDQVGIGYNVGQSLPESASFMMGMALNPASGLGKSLARNAVRTYGRNSIAKNLARIGGDIAETAIMTATTGAGRVAADALERINGSSTYEIGENGVIMYGGQKDQETVGSAVIKAIGANFIENYSEALGEYFDPLLGMSRKVAAGGLRKMNLNKWADALSDVQPSQMTASIRALREKTKFGGIFGEVMEEEIGMALNAISGVGDYTFSKEKADKEGKQWIFDLENQLTTVLSCAIMSGTLNGVEQVSNVTARRKMEKNARDAEQEAANAFGEQFAELRENIDQASPEGMVDVLRDVYMNQGYTLEQKRKLAEYAAARLQMQYYNAADAKARREVNKTQQGVLDAYEAGRHAQLPTYYNIEQEYRNSEEAINASENAENIWAAIETLNRAPLEEHDMIINDFTEEEQQLIRRYRYNAARVLGAVNSRAEQAEDLIDEYRGQITPFIMPDGTVTTAILGDNVVFVMEQNENGDAVVHTNDGRKIFAKTRDLEYVEIHNAEALIERFRQSTNEAMDIETENAFEHHPKTQAPQVGLQLQSPEGEVVITAVNDNMVEIVPAVYKDGQVQPKEGAEPKTITVDDAYAWQDSYYQGLDDAAAATASQPTADNMSSETAKNESTPTEEIEQSVSKEIADGQIAETQPTETKGVAPAAPQTARERVPKDDKGNPIYEQTDADTAWDAIVEETEGDTEMAQRVAADMLADKKAALAKLQNGKPKKGATVAEKIVNEKAHQAAIAQAQSDVAQWEAIVGTEARRREAAMSEADRYAAEMEQKSINEGLAALGEPQSLEEYVLGQLAGGAYKLRWSDRENGTKGFGSHTGLSTEEMKARLSMIDNKNGLTPEEIAHSIVENMDASFGEVDVMDVTNMVIDAVSTHASRRAMLNGMVESRAELMRQQARAEQEAKDAWYMEQYHATEEELVAYNEYLAEFVEEIYGEDTDYEQRIATFAEIQLGYDNQGTDAGLRSSANQGEGLASDREGGRSVGETEQLDRREVLADAAGVAEAEDGRAGSSVSAESDDRAARIAGYRNLSEAIAAEGAGNLADEEVDDIIGREHEDDERLDREGPVYTEERLDNGDTRITGTRSNGEVASVSIERNGKVIQVDTYEDGVLFERTDYDANGNATKVTRYKDGEVVSEQEYKDGKRKVTANVFEMAEEAQKKRKAKKKKDDKLAEKNRQQKENRSETRGVGNRPQLQDDQRYESFIGRLKRLIIGYKGTTPTEEVAKIIRDFNNGKTLLARTEQERELLKMLRVMTNQDIDYVLSEIEDLLSSDAINEDDRKKYEDAVSLINKFKNRGERKAIIRGLTGAELGDKLPLTKIDELFEMYNSDADVSELYGRVRVIAEQIGLDFWFDDNMDDEQTGGYLDVDNRVRLNAHMLYSPYVTQQEKASVIVHEILHAVADYAIEAQKDIKLGLKPSVQLPKQVLNAANSILNIYEKVVKDNPLLVHEEYDPVEDAMKVVPDYGTSSAREMLMEISNPEFRDKLKQIEYNGRSVWQRIWDALKSMFTQSSDVTNPTAYDSMAKALDVLINEFSVDAYQKYSGLEESAMRLSAEENLRFREGDNQDAAYMDAVERGDMETAQRMVDEVLEDAGYAIRGEHGTTHKFTIFNNINANIENSFGKGFYFTSDAYDAEQNYSHDEGPDLKNRIELLAERMEFEDAYEDMDYDERLEEARKRLSGGENIVISAAIRMENPCVFSIDPDGVYKETIFDVEEEYDEENDEYGEPTGLLVDFVTALNEVLAESDYWGADRIDASELIYDGYYSADQLKGKVGEMLMDITDEEGNLASTEIFRSALERMGFDGIIDNAPSLRFKNMGLSRDTKHYIAFSPNQIKQSDAVTYDNDGNIIPLSERANRANDDIRFRDGAPFFSNAERAVENIKQQKATPEQWLAMIKKDGGLKAGEDKWMGLSDWLNEQKTQGVKSLTKDEVLQFIRENQIEIEEVEYGNNPVGFDELKEEYEAMLRDEGYDAAHDAMVDRFGDGFDIAFDDLGGELAIVNEEAAATLLGSGNIINSTRLGYTTEGLENKKEIAFVVPDIESWNTTDEIHFGDAGEGRAVAWVRFGETTDEDGNRVLVIDEVQSKRHDEGRAKGYRNSRIREITKRLNELSTIGYRDGLTEDQLNEKEALEQERRDIIISINPLIAEKAKKLKSESKELSHDAFEDLESDIIASSFRLLNGIPDAPFDKNYHELVMKRMLRYAAENGFDKVAWTKGAQQAERYNLGGVVDKITSQDYGVDDNGDAIRLIQIRLKGEKDDLHLEVNKDGIIQTGGQEYEGKHLGSVVGKDTAVKLMTNDITVSGNGLRVGDEGRGALYDEMIPRFMNKYTKKWGTKVSEVTLPNVEKAGRTMWSVDVTPEMRESVMQGQPMFREGMGAISDREVSYENDPIAKFQGKPRYYGKRAAAFAERERARMQKGVEEAAKILGIEVEIITDASTLKGRKAKAKGWYDINAKKVVVVVPNHVSKGDAVRTVLHEGVAHHGLRELFGDGFDAMLDNIYNNVAPELKARIDAIAERTGVSTSVATEEYLASLAEETNFEEAMNRGWWSKIKNYFVKMLNKLGMSGLNLKEEITDNELRYLLWRSYKNLVEPNSYLKPLGYAEDVVKQKELKVGEYAEKKQAAPMAAEMSEAEEWAAVTIQRIEELEAQAAQLENEIAEMEADRDADDASRYEMWEQQLDPLRAQLEDVYAEIEGLYSLEAEEDNTRYRFIGEKGAENLDRAEEATTRLDNLKVAREMEAAKKDAKTIKMATGWERGADGKWRYEVEDIEIEAKFIKEGERLSLPTILKTNKSSDELFLAYPKMVNYKVWYDYFSGDYAGLFEPSDKRIRLNGRYLRKDNKAIHSTLIHEIQHAIQQIEGFAAGASWEDFSALELRRRGFHLYESYAYEEHGAEILHALSSIRLYAENLIEDGKYKYLGSALRNAAETYVSKGLLPNAFLDFFDTDIGSIVSESKGATSSELEEMAVILLHSEKEKSLYTSEAGEVEARNASRRMNMSIERRRKSLASETEDVAREDQIFLYDAVKSADEWYADKLIERMKESAEVLSPRLLTKEVWDNEIEGKTFQSPLGPVKLGNNQFEKNKGLGREREFGMIIPTIERPDLIIEEFDPEEGAERQTKYVFAKAFFDNKGNKHIYYANISVLKDGMEAVTSSHHLRPNQLRNKILKEHLLWNRFASDSTSSAQGGSTDQNNALSASKVSDNSSLVQEENVKSRNLEEIIAEVEREAAALGAPVRIVRSVDELPDEDTRKRAVDGQLKDYFEPRTGEVVVYEPNTDNANDAKRTILHETVGHKGLRQLVGEQRYDKAMVQLMYMLPSEVRDAVLRRAERHGWNAAIAMDEYLAEQAERDVQPTWWGKVNAMIRALLRNMGFNVMLTDADVTYLLWRSRKKLMGDDLNDMAVNAILKQAARKSAEAEAWNEQAFKDAEMRDFESNALPSIRHRMGADTNDYEKAVRTLGFKQAESWQDSMRSLLVFQQALAKASGKDISDFENAYMYENRMSSANLMEMEQYRHMVYNPLLKEIHELEQMGASRESIINYLFAKSGLERNEVFARRDAKKHAEGDATKEQQLYDKYRQKDYAGLTALTRGDTQIAALVDDHSKKKTEYDRLEQNKKRGVTVSDADLKGAKKEMNDARKAMITAIEAEAQRMVDEFERAHNTANLWDKIRNCTHATLNISHDAGVMSDEVYNELWNQFQYYIPLRGFAETTAEDVYLYLGGSDSPYNAAIKTAYGRTSLADDPIATIGNMAESAIVEANRNRLKQRFLYMVERHNTDLASISDVWLELVDVQKEDGTWTTEWRTKFAEIPDDATPSQAAEIQRQFAEHMRELAEQNPGKYANASQQPNIPYRVVKKGDRQEHHVIVKRNGKDVVITINGNPRVAQAINGLTNPEQNQGMITRITSWINRNLSANFTMRNPAFMVSNFVRDGFYTNSMVWVKENPAYARQYNKNWAICTAQIASLVSRYKRYEKGDASALDMNNDMDRMFYEFMINGGETGYTVIKSVEDYKGLISGEMKKMEAGAMGTARRVADTIGNVLDTFGRWAEDTSRFAAYMTSRQLGRTITKSIWDAKEISVNFNKKGSGNRMMGKFEQDNRLNYVLSNMSQLGRNLYVFWNAGVQGFNNFKKAAKDSPVKFTAMAGTYFTLGVIIAAAFSGDDDEDDYYNLPEYVRRNNICFKIGKGKYATLPLPIEIRAIYGLGELAYSYLSGKEGLTHREAVTKTIQQMTQVMPIDMMADGGGAMALVPSAAKPVVEVIHNVDWTGRPIYKEKTTWNQNDPTWTLAFKSTSPELVEMSRLVNEWTNKNTADGLERPYNRGWADNRYLNNPAVWEHIMEGYLGGMATMFNQTKKTLMMPFNEDLREVRNVPIASRFIKDAGKEGRSYAARNEYYDAKNIMDSWKNEMSKAKKEVLDESLTDEQRLKAAKLRSSLEQQYMEAAERWKVLDRQRKALEEAYKNDQSEENRQALDDAMMQMATLVEAYRD